jgi:hypothetical protein
MPTAELLSLSPFGLSPPVCYLLLFFGSTAQLKKTLAKRIRKTVDLEKSCRLAQCVLI